MLLNQIFVLTQKIQNLLNTLEAQKIAFSLIPVKPEVALNLRRHSLLSSALYSAKIEGIENTTDQNILARQNLEKTYSWLYTQKTDLSIDQEFLKTLHSKSQQDLVSGAGHFRTEQSAIFNSAGIVIYLTPPPQEIVSLLSAWQLQNYDLPRQQAGLCNIITSHYQFEKIHPFLDGNGRVGRLILTQQLRKLTYDFDGLLILEENIDKTRDQYYYYLQNEGKDLTGFVEYSLRLLTDSATKVLEKISRPTEIVTSHLLPRRQELVNIIRDHRLVSFDFLHRRFAGIAPSTLRFDLLTLQKNHHIQKLGRTRGAMYSPINH